MTWVVVVAALIWVALLPLVGWGLGRALRTADGNSQPESVLLPQTVESPATCAKTIPLDYESRPTASA
jgi:hypothetical protein